MGIEKTHFGWLAAPAADLRFAIRLLGKNPAFTAVAALTLALGIGANTAIWSVVDGVLLHPLPYRPGGLVVRLGEEKLSCPLCPTSAPNLLDYQRFSRSFEQLAGSNGMGFTLTRRGAEPMWLEGAEVTPNYFAVYGIPARLGRALDAAIDRPDAPKAAVLSHDTWRQRFGADPHILGKVLVLNDLPHTVVGVMPASFKLLSRSEIWVSPRFAAPALAGDTTGSSVSQRDTNFIVAIGRLRPGVGIEQAQAEMSAISHRLQLAFPAEDAKKVARLRPLRDMVVGQAAPALWMLLVAVGLILLIACANLANLLLARGTVRQREMALRASLGASRWRLLRQLLTETLLLGALGGSLGLLLAGWVVHLLTALRPSDLPRAAEVRINSEVLLFTLAVSLLAGLLAGLAPALRAMRLDLGSVLKQGGRGAGSGGHRLRRGLVIAEIAMSLALLIGAGLMIRSFAKLLAVDPGFEPGGVITAGLQLSLTRYPSDRQVAAFANLLLRRVQALPGVVAAGIVDAVPFGQTNSNGGIYIAGRPVPRPGEAPVAEKRMAGGDYFRALRIPLLRGRTFDARDSATGAAVVIVNDNLARFAWANQDPIGKQLSWDEGGHWLTVVGVVGNLYHSALDEKLRLDSYRPYQQFSVPAFTLVVKHAADPLGLAPQLRREVLALDPQQPIGRLDLLANLLDRSLAQRRLQMLLIGSLALLALALASLGVYGVMSYAVVQRRQEIGVRVALGARRTQVFSLVLRNTLVMTTLGIAAGVLGSLALGRAVEGLLYGIRSHDPGVYVAACGTLLGISLLAAYLPARRAAEIDPVVSLRGE